MKKIRGFTLLETLVSLTIFSFVVFATLAFFTNARSHFMKIKDEHETNQAAFSAIDKIKTDLFQSGTGLFIPSRLKVLECIICSEGILSITISEKTCSIDSSLFAGQTRIFLKDSYSLKKKRKLCIFDSRKGEIKEISSVGSDSCVISSPLTNSYEKNNVSIVLLRELKFYLDQRTKTLRRKVNASPAQPLLEETSQFSCSYDKMTNLVTIAISQKRKKEIKYEAFLFPKNTALSLPLSK
ncbi:MAG: type II secretion system protein [Candidatus Aminicenantes bacterium]|nr:type II secretion system protein [Candidatus Aminicenantes bacterium]